MSLNLEHALTGESVSKSSVSDIISDPGTCFILKLLIYIAPAKMDPLKPSAVNICWHYWLMNVNDDLEQSDLVHTVRIYLH